MLKTNDKYTCSKILILLAAISFCSASKDVQSLSADVIVEKDVQFTTGRKMGWSYTRNNENYFVKDGEATTDDSARADFYPDEETTVHIRPYNSQLYLALNANLMLGLSSNSEDRVKFTISPVPGGYLQYHLFVNGTTDPLVTRQTVPPFNFYPQSRYPSEPPAIFTIRYVNVDDSYDNLRENIILTAKRIQNFTFEADETRSMSYQRLLQLMEINRHISGFEIFTLAMYIVEDVGVGSGAFPMLPYLVQLIAAGGPLKWVYQVRGIDNYTMKYEFAILTEEENILPYTFTYSNETSLFGITYGGDHDLYIDPTLKERLNTPTHVFSLSLGVGYTDFVVYASGATFASLGAHACWDGLGYLCFGVYGEHPEEKFTVMKYV